MGRPLDKDVGLPEAPEAPEDDRPGRVEFDSRGNSVWRWARDVLDSTTIMLKRLDNKDLALEPTQKVPVMRVTDKPKGAQTNQGLAPGRSATRARELEVEDAPRDSAGGFDPYNSR
jgi:hypothetical protein